MIISKQSTRNEHGEIDREREKELEVTIIHSNKS